MPLHSKIEPPPLLAGQRPQKRKSHSYSRKWKKPLFLSLGLGSSLVLLSFWAKPQLTLVLASLPQQPPEEKTWVLRYHTPGEQYAHIEEQDKAIIEGFADKLLKDGSESNLKLFADSILANSPYSRIHIFKTQAYELLLALGKHQPVLITKADMLRFVSEEGVVYGQTAASDLPELNGLFEQRTTAFTMNQANELATTAHEHEILQEAVLLVQEAKKENFLFRQLHYKKYRGLFVILAETETEVAFGRAPFTDKIKKLRKLLYKLATKGQKAARIELDFEDKAFIKEYRF